MSHYEQPVSMPNRPQNTHDQTTTGTPAGVGGQPLANPVAPHRQPRFTHAGGERPLDGYTIKRGIGVGGFGEVYFAISDAGKEVALKRIQRNMDIELRGVRQCLNLKHVNLIALWDIRTDSGGDCWVVMEYVPGPSLRDVLRQYPRGMMEADVRRWFLSICAGTCYLHDRGIVHRDLKPGNIFFDDDEQIVKIGDYGLSKFIQHSRGSGHTESVGTFHYMAPEIGRGAYGKGIDIYALGVILFEILTGDLPFDGESSQEIMMKHLTALPQVERVPAEFRGVVENALAKDPDSRYANVRELLADMPWDEARSAVSGNCPSTNVPQLPGNDIPTRVSTGRVMPVAEHISEPAYCREKDGILYIDDTPEIVIGPLNDRLSGNYDMRTTGQRISVAGGHAVSGLPSRHIANEPVARAVTTGTVGIWNWFQQAPLATPLKVVIATAAALVLVVNSGWILPAAVGLGLLYLVYFAIRSWLITEDHAVTPAQKRQVVTVVKHESVLRSSMAMRPWTDRLLDLTGSMLVATVACVVLSLLGLAVGGGLLSPGIESWARYAWLAITSTAGCWLVLIASKTWEHRAADAWQRRIVMAGLGMMLGLFSFGLSGFLLIDPLPHGTTLELEPALGLNQLPQLAGSLVVFACLFGVLRWWRLADPIRRTRLSLWGTGLCCIAAVVLSTIFEREPVWLATNALMIAIGVQVAAPWIPSGDRRRAEQISAAHPT